MADTRNPVSTANLMGHPLHPILITIPIGMFAAAFLFDILFWESSHLAFATTARWLLGFGLLGAVAAAVAGLLDFFGDKRVRNISDAWHHAVGNVILILVQIFNFYWRYRYGADAALPVGFVLSTIAVLIMIYTGWKGGELVFRHRVAVYDEPRP